MSVEIIDTTDDVKKEMKSGIKRILTIEKEIKEMQDEKKRIKKEMKDKGVDVAVASKVLTLLKRNAKEEKDPKMAEARLLVEDFEKDRDIDDILGLLFEENK